MDGFDVLERDVEALRTCVATHAATASGEQALRVAAAIAQVRHAADALLAPYAARLDELSDPARPTRFARWKGFPSASALLSSVTGLSVGEASKLIGIGKALARVPAAGEGDAVAAPWAVVPDVPGFEWEAAEELAPGRVPPPAPVVAPSVSPLAAGIRDGSLGTEKANIIRRTLEDMAIDTRETEELLVAKAHELELVELRRLCLTVLAERDPEGHAAREARQRDARFMRFYEEPDGMIAVFAKLDPASAAPIKAWFEAEMQAQVFAQRDLAPEQQRSLGRIFADIFVTTARHAAGCTRATSRPKSTLVIHASKTSIESGKGFARCDGIEAPLTISTALAVAVDAEFSALLLDDEGAPLRLGRTQRSASRAQRHALAKRDKGCAKCSEALSKCDAHHIIEWDRGGHTDIDNLVMLCVGCHHRVHDFGWGIVVEANQVWFIPPSDIDPLRRRQPGSSVRLAA